ncbi:MAG TPA: DNA repair protein RecN [Caldisericia bacterium]|nr:DNA repair protein RecN [Caldisericia bacterium]HOL82724.1 DNA repair protein RecN [Caldisericia bacterium]HPC56893.1 DNA repair protein RecN [Caldisericia bacterium]HPP43441.1 DNA repair protein RecN [Caldisericia bacterium]HRT36761.1 DNA repair protein RecN [Caldisericia bacterium]
MLKNLTVKNFAIIEDLSVEFEKGLNVITGETGSGKSILITALGVALGNKFSKDMLREGEDKSILTVTFDISENKRLKKYLIDKGIDDDILFFQREITKDGKQKLKINGMVLPYSIYREIGEVLVDIHGQHEPQSLLDKNKHLELLDRFIGDDFLLKRDEFSKKLTRYKEINEEIEEILTRKEERERRRDYLTFVINEIEKENISEEEEKELLSKREILKNVSKLKETYNEIFQNLEGFEENEGAIDKITKSIKRLENIESIDKLSTTFKNELNEIEIKISEILNQIKIRKEEIEYSPDELEIIEERLKIYDDLKRKYGKDVQEIINFLEESKKELKNLDTSFERVEELKKEKEILENELIEIGKYLREKRVEKAKELEKYIEEELSTLAMEKAKFFVKFFEEENEEGIKFNEKILKPNQYGFEKIEFFISPNPGESEKPLIKIASGGELSRVMLSIRTIFGKVDEIPCIVFDEIDQGIGGRVGEMIGRKLLELSKNVQVISITHLPQIASFGDNHIQLMKSVSGERTYLTAKTLNEEERVYEIARMLGGVEITESAVNHAKELLSIGREVKGV